MFVSAWFQIFSLPFRGSFHLSLALLSALSVSQEYLALCDGPHGFTPVFPWQAVLGTLSKETVAVSPTGLSPSMAGLSRPLGCVNRLSNPLPPGGREEISRDTVHATSAHLTRASV